MFSKILRALSYIYHLVLAIFLLGMATVALLSANQLRLEMLPWKGDDLAQWLLWGSILGILSIILAVTGIFPYLFPLYALVVFIMMFRGYMLQPYTFAGKESFYFTLWLLAGALLAFLASLTLFKFRRRRAA